MTYEIPVSRPSIPRIRFDADRNSHAQRIAATFGWLATVGHTPGHLREIIKRELDDGLKGTDYTGVRVNGGESSSSVERRALARTDQGHDDLHRLDMALQMAAEAEAIVYDIVNRRDPIVKRKAGDLDPDKRKPGKGNAPPGRCKSCWGHGTEEYTERYDDFCRWCGDWHAAHGCRPVAALWRIHQQGKRVTTADIRKHAGHLLGDARTA
jgi:hypothetical protein